ncbi:DUF6471 domain-containing protein [Noviherbaspirillum denitrificans]|uniref:DUF6471 domain-containing protein n=1 Tax=Noviherbaspirillum denitrificans TaxID=1968433 RepID=A0A254TM34_9BURK|nr:DUF6471 domain-containing protein [Noviherbaspirillum denitrificans]OWW20768.1 hypothetical protein AYR66_16095 [Noviherbaspirillum denitrificans]
MDWQIEAKRLLRAEMVRMGVSVNDLAEALASVGMDESPKSLAVKISRGKFQLAFFLQCMSALGVESVTVTLPKSKPTSFM